MPLADASGCAGYGVIRIGSYCDTVHSPQRAAWSNERRFLFFKQRRVIGMRGIEEHRPTVVKPFGPFYPFRSSPSGMAQAGHLFLENARLQRLVSQGDERAWKI